MSEYTLTKHRGKWSLTYRDGDRRVRITTGTADRGLAESRARELWRVRTEVPAERVADIWPRYIKDRSKDGVNTEKLQNNWNRLKPHFGYKVGISVTREDCRDYREALLDAGYSASTAKTDLELLRASLRWRYNENAPKLWVGPASPPRDRWLTKEQARQILDATETPHVRLFIMLALTTGARSGAILDLTWDRVDFDQNTIDYRPAGRVQTNKRRTVVPMSQQAKEALQIAHRARQTDNVIEYGSKPVKSIKKAIERLSGRTGVKFSPHTFRHTCAVWMAQDNVPMQQISQFLGHTSLRMTEQVYARYSPEFMKDASAATTF